MSLLHLMRVIWIGVLKLKHVQVLSTHVDWNHLSMTKGIDMITAQRFIPNFNGKYVTVTQMAAINKLVSLNIPKHSTVHQKDSAGYLHFRMNYIIMIYHFNRG